MTSSSGFYHALKVNPAKCSGCTICIFKCPTHALRIRNGKASINDKWCIDCGECYMYCPARAIYVEEDDFNKIFDYSYRVALMPAIFLGQFSKKKHEEEIYAALYTLGFTHVFPVELSVDAIKHEVNKQLQEVDEKPLISSFCPAAIRLIQIRYPHLTEQIMTIKSPVHASALLVQEDLLNKGAEPQEIGLFYITPCAAKIAEIKGKQTTNSLISGVINMDTLYNKVNQVLARNSHEAEMKRDRMPPKLSSCEMCWSLTNSEACHFEGRTLAIDEIHNVIEFLERMETTNNVQNVDFLELRACDRSCAGGALTPENRFLATERLGKRAEKNELIKDNVNFPSEKAWKRMQQDIHIEPILPMAKLNYTGGIESVLKQMSQVREMMCYLPGIDCGACGAPGCKVLAEDIIRGEAQLSSCLFLQRDLEHHGRLSGERAYALIEKVWGKNRLEKDCYKRGAKLEGETRTDDLDKKDN